MDSEKWPSESLNQSKEGTKKQELKFDEIVLKSFIRTEEHVKALKTQM